MSAYPTAASRRRSIYIAPLLIPALAISAAIVLLIAASPAQSPAQSSAQDPPYCKPSDRSMEENFRKSGAVIIGRLIKIKPGHLLYWDRYVYRVRQVYKEGDGRWSVGRKAKVASVPPCHMPGRLGRSYGLFLESPFSIFQERQWHMNRVVSRTRMRKAARRHDW
jgi:hypothetical protein